MERAKKCLDFAATIYVIHAAICWSYSGFPLQLAWYSVMQIQNAHAVSFLRIAKLCMIVVQVDDDDLGGGDDSRIGRVAVFAA